jgi:hypothetical protein
MPQRHRAAVLLYFIAGQSLLLYGTGQLVNGQLM